MPEGGGDKRDTEQEHVSASKRRDQPAAQAISSAAPDSGLRDTQSTPEEGAVVSQASEEKAAQPPSPS